MAKDILGREITNPALVRMQNTMNKEPVMTTVGRGLAAGARKAVEVGTAGASGMGAIADKYNPASLVAVPLAGMANVASTQLQNLKNGINGTVSPAPQFKALTASEALQQSFPTANAAMPPPVKTSVAVPAAAPATATPPTYAAGTGLPSAMQIASDKARASAAQATSDKQLGIQTPGAAGINVQRQANGVLSFTGNGGGDGTGAVSYNGLPNWKSAQGGAGQGAADFGGQAFKPAQAALAAGTNPMTKYSEIADKIAAGEGGAVGVAQNKAALAALAPLLERQMANDNSTGIAKMETDTRRRGQDQGLAGEMARVNASIYGTDVGAQTAREGHEIEKERTAVALTAAKAKASGDPLKVRQAQLLELEWSAKTGLDPITGEALGEAQRKQLYQRVLELKTPQTVVPYGGFGMAGDE